MRLSRLVISCLLVLVPTLSSYAQLTAPIEIRGNIGVVSDYVFRGISMSDESLVSQGGVDIILPKGFYLGAWASGVDKPWGGIYNAVPDVEDFEYDLYAGWQWSSELGNFGVDSGVIQYAFSDDPDELVWSEFYFSLNLWRKLRGKISTQIDGLDFGTYYEASFRQPLFKEFDATIHAGHFDVEERLVRGIEQYSDFSIAIGRSFRGFRFDLTYHRTDRDGRARYLKYADDRVVLSIKRDFELYPNFRMLQFR